MRDDAEQVLGLGHVRLRRQHLAAQAFRLEQPPLAAVTIGEHQGLAERHELLRRVPRDLVHGGSIAWGRHLSRPASRSFANLVFRQNALEPVEHGRGPLLRLPHAVGMRGR
jgi:hypothetical protein